MNPKPLVSVIIPTYNRADMIEEAIRSVMKQTYHNKELIVIDDGSTDHTMQVVKKFPDIHYVFQSHKGQAAARNAGWKNSKGVYLASLDSDDVWHEDFLEKTVAALEEGELDFAFANWNQELKEGGWMDFFLNDPLLQPYITQAKSEWVTLQYAELRDLYVKGCPSPSSSLVLRSSSIVSGWNEKMNIADDWCMILDMVMSKKIRAAFTIEKLWIKHINCNNIYDGRDHIEVNKLLYVADTQNIIVRHLSSLTKDEHMMMEKKYLKNLVRSAKHSLFIYSNFAESMRLFKRALITNPFYTTKVVSELVFQAGKRQFHKDQDEH